MYKTVRHYISLYICTLTAIMGQVPMAYGITMSQAAYTKTL